jgi:hypothetical protein
LFESLPVALLRLRADGPDQVLAKILLYLVVVEERVVDVEQENAIVLLQASASAGFDEGEEWEDSTNPCRG